MKTGKKDQNKEQTFTLLYRKTMQLRGVEDQHQQQSLLMETQQLIKLSHSSNYHQHQLYNQMLWRLAGLADKHKKKQQLRVVCDQIMKINPPSSISNYFSIISYLVDADEVAKLEQLLKMIEGWPNQAFTKQIQQRQSMKIKLKEDIKEMKKSLIKNGKELYIERVNAIIKKLGVNYKEIDLQMINEHKLKKLHDQIKVDFPNKKWARFDKTQEKVQQIIKQSPALRNTFDYEQCTRVGIVSMRKQKKQIIKTLSLYRQIEMNKIYTHNGSIIHKYIQVMESCFAVELFNEGFSLMKTINSLPISPSHLSYIKSKIPDNSYKKIITNASIYGVGQQENQLIKQLYQKLQLPSIEKDLKEKNQMILCLQSELKQPLKKARKYYNEHNWPLFDEQIAKITTMANENKLYKHTFSYEWCILMKIDSWRARENKATLAQNLPLYDEIKLSTFCSNERILQKQISLAACCFKMNLHQEGMERISRVNAIDANSIEIKEIKEILNQEYLQSMVQKGLKQSNEEEKKELKKFTQKLELK